MKSSYPIKRSHQRIIITVSEIAVLSFLLFSSCISYTNFETARMLKKNKTEVAPYASKSKILMLFNEDPVDESLDWNLIYGLSVRYGISSTLNLSLNVENITLESFPGIYGFRVGIKRALSYDKTAVSFNLGYYDDYLMRLGVSIYSNLYFTRTIYYCFNPSFLASYYLADDIEHSNSSLSAIISNSMTFQLGKHFYFRPEASFDLFYAIQGLLWVNYGIAGGVTF